MKVTVRIENAYSDGHESSREVVLDAPDNLGVLGDLSEWFEDVVYPETGDGHGADNDLGSCYVATIVGVEAPAYSGLAREERRPGAGLIGVRKEWID